GRQARRPRTGPATSRRRRIWPGTGAAAKLAGRDIRYTRDHPSSGKPEVDMRFARHCGALLLALATAVYAAPVAAQPRVTSPEQEFGHRIGADYQLPNYQKLMAYWHKLAGESDRMVL